MFDKDRYTQVVALLGMLGVENAAQIPPERAEAKLATRLGKQGVPEGCSPEQKKLADEILGTKLESKAEAKTEPKAKEQSGKQSFRLTDGKDKNGPVEMITPQMAEVRNKRRTDGKVWAHDPAAAPSKSEKVENVKAPETKGKSKGVVNRPAKAAAKAGKKVKAPKPKADKKTKTDKAPKTGKDEKSEKPAKRKGKSHAGRNGGGTEVFRRIMEDRRPHKKEDVVKAVVKAGVGEASARAYLVWAKRSTKATNPAKGGNPFGFVIVETLDKNGVKSIQKK